ncbi:hypothetical protein [Halorhabdus sp. BNX81]|uniref:hypothetical protein n=1 Tax=Halorhabdus sp. BNX81 TaxID=2980181 RepID=UPI0023DD3FF6|nr:hypothetical protein [Halorhabdus sp. BNX81]WEL20409.1 hypothetical protein HBNXHr_0334 [Halorhabdus sp. BNX81]
MDTAETEPSGNVKSESDGNVTTPGPYDADWDDIEFINFEMAYEQDDSLDEKGSPWDSADTDGTLTISAKARENPYESNVHVSASDVFIRGSSITTVGNGKWSEQIDANPENTERKGIDGDSIVIEANSDYELQIVYDKPKENGRVTISGWSGPDSD